MTINTLAVTLANSGAALAESSSSGTSVGSSSISNPDSETITYTLAVPAAVTSVLIHQEM